MDLLIILTYVAFAWSIFKIFKRRIQLLSATLSRMS